jgi:hypothetical protein
MTREREARIRALRIELAELERQEQWERQIRLAGFTPQDGGFFVWRNVE